MFVIVGIVVVLVSVIGGYLMEHGNLHVLFQPAELVIIGGAAAGAFLISSPGGIVSAVVKSLKSITSDNTTSKEHYLDVLSLLYQLFTKMRREGILGIESDIEHPEKSAVFKKYPKILGEPAVLNFICDNFKVVSSGSELSPHEMEGLMDTEIETMHHEALIPSHSIAKIADGLPGLGIVAAVLGVVLTMGKIDQPPSVLGECIGAALVGTFLGVLLCYGFVGPIAANIENKANSEVILFQVIKGAFVASVKGLPPQVCVEFGRRAIPEHEKPTFSELEKTVKGKAK